MEVIGRGGNGDYLCRFLYYEHAVVSHVRPIDTDTL